ncbi:hypothetical protein Daus18300_014259 [Diaporthe australafricana]|uniref:Protein kinase domain-containing protein n=1 Tax=Diaporthe australafricana TaxID=127596 RepID=A0ABR3VW13_9PEZI
MDRGFTETRTSLAPQGSVNLNDLRQAGSQTRANFTRLTAVGERSRENDRTAPDFITFISLSCSIYQAQSDDLVPVQQYPSVLETYQGKGHTSLVTHAQVDLSGPSSLSRGGFGSYSEGIVIKRPRHSILENKSDGLNSFITELRIRSHVSLKSHPNIARLRGIGWDFEDEDATIPRPIILEEFAPQGALDNFWLNWKFVSISFEAKLDFCRDIAEGLSVLHTCGVVHGDIKPENILVFPRKDARNSFSLKLTDFGHSVLEADKSERLPAFTPQWSAPEVTKKKRITFTQMKATDYYSFGLVMLSIMLGRAFYTDIDDVKSCKEDGSILYKLLRVIEEEDKFNDDSDMEVGTVAQLLYKTVQLSPEDRSLEECISIIEVYKLENQATSDRMPPVKAPAVPVPALSVEAKVSQVIIGYHTLIGCSHQLKAHIVNTLRDLAERPDDPRQPAAAWELTICYFSGFGVPRDFDAALKWLSVARELGVTAGRDLFKPLQEAIVVAMEAQSHKEAAFPGKPRLNFRNQQSSNNIVSNTETSVSDLQAEDNGERTIGQEEHTSRPSRSAVHTTDESNVLQKQIVAPETNALCRKYFDGSNKLAQSLPSMPLPMPSHVRDAIEAGSLNQLRDIITREPSVLDSADEQGNTPLLLAAHHKQLGILRYLISHPDIKASAHNKFGQTALHFLAHFENESVVDFVLPLVDNGIDLLREALPMRTDSAALVIFHGLRCCAVLNSILHNKTILLAILLEAAHSNSSVSMCQICEAGSRFRRILAVALSLFRIDVLEILTAHLLAHRKLNTINLANIQVWAGQKLLRLYQVPFSSVAVSAMDLPEDFFRAIMYGSNYDDVLERTLDFLAATASTRSKSKGTPHMSLETKMLRAASAGGSLDAVNSLLNRMKESQQKVPEWISCQSRIIGEVRNETLVKWTPVFVEAVLNFDVKAADILVKKYPKLLNNAATDVILS